MPQVDCTISFNSPTNSYYVGQNVCGTVDINVNQGITVKRLVLHITGLAEVKFEPKSSNKSVDANESIIFANIRLIPNKMNLPLGNHKYEFNFLLPQILPSSIEGKMDDISFTTQYKAVVIFVRPFQFDLKFEKEFFVVSGIDLNFNRNLTLPYSVNNSDMIVSLPRMGWIAGEKIPIKIQLKNQHDNGIHSIVCALYKEVSLHFAPVACCNCCCNCPGTTKDRKQKITEDMMEYFTGKTIYDIDLMIPVKGTISSTVDPDMKIVNIHYIVEVEVKKNSSKSFTTLTVPITVCLMNANPAPEIGHNELMMNAQWSD